MDHVLTSKLFDRLQTASEWDTTRRAITSRDFAKITAAPTGKTASPSLQTGPRSPALTQPRAGPVIRLNAAGQGAKARDTFDPLFPQIEAGTRSRAFCAILDHTRFLAQPGTNWQPARSWLTTGDQTTTAELLATPTQPDLKLCRNVGDTHHHAAWFSVSSVTPTPLLPLGSPVTFNDWFCL